jgi:hypothetical protein
MSTDRAENSVELTAVGPTILWRNASNQYKGVGTSNPLPVTASGAVSLAGGNANIGVVYLGQSATASGPILRYKLLSAASTNSTLILSGQHKVLGYSFCNTGASFAFLKLYNKATAPTVGTDTPVETIGIPPNSTAVLFNPIGVSYSLGIGLAVTGGYADADTTAVTAGQVIGSLFYV